MTGRVEGLPLVLDLAPSESYNSMSTMRCRFDEDTSLAWAHMYLSLPVLWSAALADVNGGRGWQLLLHTHYNLVHTRRDKVPIVSSP